MQFELTFECLFLVYCTKRITIPTEWEYKEEGSHVCLEREDPLHHRGDIAQVPTMSNDVLLHWRTYSQTTSQRVMGCGGAHLEPVLSQYCAGLVSYFNIENNNRINIIFSIFILWKHFFVTKRTNPLKGEYAFLLSCTLVQDKNLGNPSLYIHQCTRALVIWKYS